jgi:hypothetical protein
LCPSTLRAQHEANAGACRQNEFNREGRRVAERQAVMTLFLTIAAGVFVVRRGGQRYKQLKG